jgi:Protein of unknown function (DUF3341)
VRVELEAGCVAEFATPEALTEAVVALRRLGYRRLDTFTPYAVKPALEALELPRSRVTLFALIAGLAGAAGAYALEWWMSAVDYPINVGGRPPHSGPAFIPITFEMGVLFAGFTAFLCALAFARLPRLSHPIFEVEGFESASIDRFWLGIDVADPRFDRDRTEADVAALGPSRIAWPGVAP